ncbi:unnamed protein product [Darwinula stevensoni]|uniref:Uncharacterized protein n=1 Tax=Darwinula stevensoni TaxID=69355 RepID=A0A7R8X610_9CRUS|nr:unnamed protein product [Darwinula stevensoni]CAG0881596.1 unnamed protein product [Darwinula stevensoni]
MDHPEIQQGSSPMDGRPHGQLHDLSHLFKGDHTKGIAKPKPARPLHRLSGKNRLLWSKLNNQKPKNKFVECFSCRLHKWSEMHGSLQWTDEESQGILKEWDHPCCETEVKEADEWLQETGARESRLVRIPTFPCSVKVDAFNDSIIKQAIPLARCNAPIVRYPFRECSLIDPHQSLFLHWNSKLLDINCQAQHKILFESPLAKISDVDGSTSVNLDLPVEELPLESSQMQSEEVEKFLSFLNEDEDSEWACDIQEASGIQEKLTSGSGSESEFSNLQNVLSHWKSWNEQAKPSSCDYVSWTKSVSLKGILFHGSIYTPKDLGKVWDMKSSKSRRVIHSSSSSSESGDSDLHPDLRVKKDQVLPHDLPNPTSCPENVKSEDYVEMQPLVTKCQKKTERAVTSRTSTCHIQQRREQKEDSGKVKSWKSYRLISDSETSSESEGSDLQIDVRADDNQIVSEASTQPTSLQGSLTKNCAGMQYPVEKSQKTGTDVALKGRTSSRQHKRSKEKDLSNIGCYTKSWKSFELISESSSESEDSDVFPGGVQNKPMLPNTLWDTTIYEENMILKCVGAQGLPCATKEQMGALIYFPRGPGAASPTLAEGSSWVLL